MPRKSKGLTCKYPLVMTDRERAILERVKRVHADAGIPISLNDAIRICIRRIALPTPTDEPSALRALQDHLRDCEHCTPTDIKCPEGWRVRDAYGRFATPPPPAPEVASHPTPAAAPGIGAGFGFAAAAQRRHA